LVLVYSGFGNAQGNENSISGDSFPQWLTSSFRPSNKTVSIVTVNTNMIIGVLCIDAIVSTVLAVAVAVILVR
jgi:hypothetical protein